MGSGTSTSATSGGASATVSVLADALPPGTVISIYPVTDSMALSAFVPVNQRYIVAFAISWTAPLGNSPSASAPITMTINDAKIVSGDVLYKVTAGGLDKMGTATRSGVATISFVSDPIFLVSTAPSASIHLTRSRFALSGHNVPVAFSCTISCRGRATLTFTMTVKRIKNHKTITMKESAMLAQSAYSIKAANRAQTIKLWLTSLGLNAFAHASTHSVRVTLKIAVRGGAALTRSVVIA